MNQGNAFGFRWMVGLAAILFASCSDSNPLEKGRSFDKEGEVEDSREEEPVHLENNSSPIIAPPPPTQLQVAPTENLAKLPPGEAEIQIALRKTNPGYEGQGVFHKEGPTIIAAELAGCGLKDLSPLRGLKLMGVDLSGNPLRDLRHLRGMPIRTLYLENTEIADLRPLQGMPIAELRLNQCAQLRSLKGLEGMPIENLYLPETGVSDLTPLKGAPIRQLWLNGSPVVDIQPLKNAPLISLTLHRTNVADLSVIADLPLLERLHVGETKVTDLTPLKGINLTRLVFTPNRIEKGIEEARRLRGLNEIGTQFDNANRDLMPPASFWARYDEGAYK